MEGEAIVEVTLLETGVETPPILAELDEGTDDCPKLLEEEAPMTVTLPEV